VEVDWLHGVSGSEVHNIETLREFQQVLKVLAITSVTCSVKFHVVGWASYGSKRHPISADVESVVWIARVQCEFAWAGLDGLFYERRVKANTVVGDLCSARFGDEFECLGKQEVDSDFRKHS
jgi:hypothetical protein